MCDKEENYFKITVEQSFGKDSIYNQITTIKSFNPDLDFDDFIETMIKPICIAIGYQPGTVDKYFGEE